MKQKKIYKIVVIWLAILAIIIVPRFYEEPKEKIEYEFIRVVDGDTILVQYESKPVSVRLIGVDAPESVHPDENSNTPFGELADEYLEELLAGISLVYLEFDEEQYDSYERLLAYVYLEEDASFENSLNYRLVADGYAINKEYPPNVAHARELEAACREAKESRKGLWKLDEVQSIWGEIEP